MLKDLLKEGGIYTIANLLTKGVSLMLIPFYTSYFTTGEYGVLGILSVFGGFVGAIVSFQLYQGMGRYIAEDGITLEEKQRIGSSAFFFTSITYASFAIIAYVFSTFFIDILSADIRIKESTFLLSVSAVCINALFYTLGVQLKYLRKVNQFALTSFIHAIFNILLIIFFAFKLDYGLNSVFYAGLIVAPLIILLQLYYLRDYLVFYLGRAEIKRMLKFSLPLIPAATAYLILNFIDRIYIKEMMDKLSYVGIYDLAFKFSSVIGIVIVAFQSALGPIMYKNHKLESTKTELIKVFNVFFGIGTLGVLTLSIFSFETLKIFTQPSFYEAKSLMPLFYISTLITGLGMFSLGIYLKERTKILPLITILAGGVNIVLNYFLILKLELIGAAIATLASVFINYAVMFIISQKLYPVNYNFKKIIALILIFIIFVLLGYNFEFYIESSYLMVFLVKIITIISYLIILLKMKMIDFALLIKK